MWKIADKSHIQIKMLNNSKGPAVRSLRAQADKVTYPKLMLETLENLENLTIIEAMIEDLIVEDNIIKGVITENNESFLCDALILTTGTYLKSKILIGDKHKNEGPHGERRSINLSNKLKDLGFEIQRLKTGTPQRLDKKSINFDILQKEEGDKTYWTFSYDDKPSYNIDEQEKCYLVYTNEDTYAHSHAALNGYKYFIFYGDEILPSRVYIDKTSVTINVGAAFTFEASVAPHFDGYTTVGEIAWMSDNENTASVQDGVVTGISKGNTYIYAVCRDLSARVSVSVRQPVTAIVLDREKVTIPVGETITITATVLPEDASSKYVYWSTSDSKVATVSSGKITAKGLGTATITARTSDGSFKAYVEVTVVEYIPGELDGDGEVDMNDAILLLQHSLFPELYPIDYKGNLDLNCDGAVDANDAILLLQYSLFPELYPIS